MFSGFLILCQSLLTSYSSTRGSTVVSIRSSYCSRPGGGAAAARAPPRDPRPPAGRARRRAGGRAGPRAPLAQATLVQAGLVALKYVNQESDFLGDAIRWLRFAVNHTVEPLSTPQEIYHGLAQAFALVS